MFGGDGEAMRGEVVSGLVYVDEKVVEEEVCGEEEYVRRMK